MPRYRHLTPLLQPLFHEYPLQRCIHRHSSSPSFVNILVTRTLFTSPQVRSTHFDTLKVAQRLEEHGFTPEQSKAVMELLKSVIDESIIGLTSTMVTRGEHDKVQPNQEQS